MHPAILTPAVTVPFAKRLTSADGTAVYAEAIGDPSNPSIVFLHGFSLSTVVWDCIFHEPRYTDKFYLVRYDLRGHGRSGKPETPEGYASERFAQDFAAVMEAFDLKRPVLVGWSMGSIVITDIAAHLPPTTLSGAICISSLPYLAGDAGRRIMSPTILEIASGSLQNADVGLFAKTKIRFLDSLFSHPDQISHELKCLWLGASLACTPADMTLGFSRTQDPEPMYKMAREGTLPLLVLQGRLDGHLDAEKLVAEIKPLWKDAEVVILEGIGHAVFYEDTEGVMQRIGHFVRRVQA
ncbi:unnamed protein product [Peniophora sp. CBMAI 1063]|nr:unnamed protein product [Peniophora sp. CBMAI 1063]